MSLRIPKQPQKLFRPDKKRIIIMLSSSNDSLKSPLRIGKNMFLKCFKITLTFKVQIFWAFVLKFLYMHQIKKSDAQKVRCTKTKELVVPTEQRLGMSSHADNCAAITKLKSIWHCAIFASQFNLFVIAYTTSLKRLWFSLWSKHSNETPKKQTVFRWIL